MSDTSIQQIIKSIFSTIDEDLEEFEPLRKITANSKIRPGHIFLGVVLIILFISAITQALAHILITLFAIVYPSYMSFKAIHKGQNELRKKWLIYWIVFAFATIFDKILSSLLFFLPVYYSLKLLFLIWLFYPRTDGINLIYSKLIKPHFSKITESMKKLHQN